MNAFVSNLALWRDTGDDAFLIRALRSPYSGVPHDIAAAYATIAARTGPLLDAIARERLALPAAERDAVFSFSERARTVYGGSDASEVFSLDHARGAESPSGESAAFALAAPAEAERGSGVRSRQGHFSASALNAYAECPRKWYYRYVCTAVEDPGSSASTYGTAFHAALEDFHAEFPHPDSSHERDMRGKITGYVNWAFERYRNEFSTAVEVELHKRRAQRTAQKYVDWLIAESRRAPFTVVGRELGASLEIGGYPFIGYIDRVDCDDATGAVTIIDYKTGSIANSAGEYREKVRKFRDFQLPFYYWARTEAGDRVSRLALIPLKDALLDVHPIALEVVPGDASPRREDGASATISIGDLERARARMIDICRELTSAEVDHFAVTGDPSACTFCAYKLACNDRPHAERMKFGR